MVKRKIVTISQERRSLRRKKSNQMSSLLRKLMESQRLKVMVMEKREVKFQLRLNTKHS